MRTVRYVLLLSLAVVSSNIFLAAQQSLQFVPVAPCRVLDTRTSHPIQGGTFATYNLQTLGQAVGCQEGLGPGVAFSLNVTVIPHGYLNYLTIWPTGQTRPVISLMNSYDGRTKANAAIVQAGGIGHNSVNIYVTNTADVLLDVNGFFEPANAGAFAYYALPQPCRIADTRTGQPLAGGQERDFDVLGSSCNIPGNAQAYSLNFTAVPNPSGHPLGFLTVWPAGGPRPTVSTLNDPTGTVVANAALLPANGTNGEIAVYPSDQTDLVIDIDGYFAPATPTGGQAFYLLTPCRALDTRPNSFVGLKTFNIQGSPCAPPSTATAYVMNATAIPLGFLDYLTLWPSGQQPLASTLNARDGAVTSNMAITGSAAGSINAYAPQATNLLLDLSGYMAPLGTLTVFTTQLPQAFTGQAYNGQLAATGGEPPYTWTITSGSLPPGVTVTSAGTFGGIPTTTGTYPISVKVTDQFNATATKDLSISVLQGIISVTNKTLSNGALGVAYSTNLQAAGGVPPYTWSVSNGTLPDGLHLNSSTGAITGTPTTAGTSAFQIQATDSQSNIAQANLGITVNGLVGNNSLNGHYAFSAYTYNNGQPVFMAGSFTALGDGTLTAGIVDVNSGTGSPANGYPFNGTYSLNPNGLGDLVLNVAAPVGTLHFSMSLSSNGNGQLILDNDSHTQNTGGSGQLYLQNTSAFLPPRSGTYAIGSIGADVGLHRYAKAGAFNVLSSSITSGEEDVNDNGAMTNRSFTGNFGPPTSLNGRGNATMTFGSVTNNYVYYVVSTSQFVILGTDTLGGTAPLTLGVIQAQLAAIFNNAALNGNSVVQVSGLSGGGSDVLLGVANWNGGGGGTVRLDENNNGTMSQATRVGVYNVELTGRATTTGIGAGPSVMYLYNFNQGFILGQDSKVLAGVLDIQTSAPPLNNQAIVSLYNGGTVTPVSGSIVDAVSYFQADGSGNLNGVQDFSSSSGTGQQNLVSSYVVDASGRAVVTPSTGNLGGIMYVISNKKVAFLPTGTGAVLSTFSTGATQ